MKKCSCHNSEVCPVCYVNEAIEAIKKTMDDVVQSHVGKNVAPYTLTDESHIGAILIGMGVAEVYHSPEEGFLARTKFPVSIFWDGEMFQIIMKEH